MLPEQRGDATSRNMARMSVNVRVGVARIAARFACLLSIAEPSEPDRSTAPLSVRRKYGAYGQNASANLHPKNETRETRLRGRRKPAAINSLHVFA